ncbi:hypothetical protein RHSIM_Rhsim08G0024900 [Rhododendron simsii]|uniref:Legume lectin domain-containing protein n=1 Tax=Rhododendron simsii TaxID=118357 RepID=A0A834GQ68_RHOSS|nr:hypothetical protein RHSIM_Rhsim08G0024900 [Rhododendron simsii]
MGLAVKLRMIAAMLLCFTAVTALNLKTFTATYGPFNYTYFDIFGPKNSAIMSHGVLQLTPNSAYQEGLLGRPLENQVGRTLLKRPFTLSEPGYNKKSDRVASFNSSFLFSVCPLGSNTTPGEGLAFIIAQPFKHWLPPKSSGRYLGLTNNNTDGDPAFSLVAIEFDNVKQEFDPDANHVGLNINSIISNVTASLTPLGIELAPDDEARFYNAWVQYDGLRMIAAVLLCFTAVAAQNFKTFTTTTTHEPFKSELLELAGSATIFNGALQLTPNSAYERRLVGMPLENQAGRARFNKRFKLSEQFYHYNKTKDRVASFNSSFLFSVCPLGRNTPRGRAGLLHTTRGLLSLDVQELFLSVRELRPVSGPDQPQQRWLRWKQPSSHRV